MIGNVSDHVLVTGALGFLGAWVTALLIREGTAVIAYDLGDDDHRLRLVTTPDELARAERVKGDVTDGSALVELIREREISHIVHLAALQAPYCAADPVLGAEVNV